MKDFSHFALIHLIHLGDCLSVMHLNMQLFLPQTANFPKQSAHGLEKDSFLVIHFDVHSSAPQHSVPQSSKAFLAASYLVFPINLSLALHSPDNVEITLFISSIFHI